MNKNITRLAFDMDKPRNLEFGLCLGTLDFFYGLGTGDDGMTQGYQQNHSLSLKLFKPFFDNDLLKHGRLPHVLPLAVHLDLGHLPDTQGYLGLLSEKHVLPLRPFKSYRL